MNSLGIAGFIDFETTGLDPSEDEIIEFSLVLFSYDKNTGEIIKIVDEYSGLREPTVPIKRAASEVHGIYKRHVKGMKLDEKRISELLNQCDFLIAHNAKFDKGFYDNLSYVPPLTWYCSMSGIPWTSYGFKSKGLHRLLDDHGISIKNAHRANDDCKAAIELLKKKDKNGNSYFKALLNGRPYYEYKGSAKEIAVASENQQQQIKHQNSKGCLTLILVVVLMVWVVNNLY